MNNELLLYLEGELNNQNYRLECLLKDNKTDDAFQQCGVIKYLQLRIKEVNAELHFTKSAELSSGSASNIMNSIKTESKLKGLLGKITPR